MSLSPSSVRVIKPFSPGIPSLSQYLSDMWARREFVQELSRSERAEEQLDTVFGQLWSVISPLLSAGIYYLFIFVVQGQQQGQEFFLHLMAGIFIFEFMSIAAARGSTSVVRAGALISNTSFPRALLPIADVITALRVFLPAMFVYFVFHVALGQPFSVEMFQAIPAFLLILIFGCGISMFASAAQVYFRDTVALLPFILRLLLFASPVLFFPEQAKNIITGHLLVILNPFFCMIQIFSGSLVRGDTFDMATWIIASTWAIGTFLVGFIFLTSREGEFAARV
ncbi:MAG: ABC transporter permease [Actinobacteria bacterium]|nr:ABC transporter permease [Actinomycetota bacterium]